MTTIPPDSSVPVSELGVNPWFLAHGVIFIIGFSILMPLTTFLILYNKERFYTSHTILGIVVLACILASGACLVVGKDMKESGAEFIPENESPLGYSHLMTGAIAKYVTAGVILCGIILRIIQMPPRVRLVVRVAHGVAGAIVTFFGVFVVWNGWIRLALTLHSVLDASPIIWSLLLIGCSGFYMYYAWRERNVFFFAASTSSADKTDGVDSSDLENPPDSGTSSAPIVIPTLGDFVGIVKDKKFFVFNKSEIIVVDDTFEHPGGNQVLEQFYGKDITEVFSGQASFFDESTKLHRSWMHSKEAMDRLRSMGVGVLRNTIDTFGGDSTEEEGSSPNRGMNDDFADLAVALSRDSKSVGIVTGVELVNKNNCYKILLKIIDNQVFALISLGSKLLLSGSYGPESSVERTYTVAELDASQKTITLFIKVYPNGAFTSMVERLGVSDMLFISGISPALALPDNTKHVTLLAAGTGLVPMLYYLKQCAQEGSMEHTALLPVSYSSSEGVPESGVEAQPPVQCNLLWWIRNADDLFLVDQLAAVSVLQNIHTTVFFTNLTEEEQILLPKHVNIEYGRINKKIVNDAINSKAMGHTSKSNHSVVMSGPPGFIQAATEVVRDLMDTGNVSVFCLD